MKKQKPKLSIEVALDAVQMYQEQFWDALSELEMLSGRDSLDSTMDFNNATLNDILAGEYDAE